MKKNNEITKGSIVSLPHQKDGTFCYVGVINSIYTENGKDSVAVLLPNGTSVIISKDEVRLPTAKEILEYEFSVSVNQWKIIEHH